MGTVEDGRAGVAGAGSRSAVSAALRRGGAQIFRVLRRRLTTCIAGLALLGLGASAGAATVKKADDTSVAGPLVGLENGAIVLNVTAEEGKPPVRTSVPLADVVEVTIDHATD